MKVKALQIRNTIFWALVAIFAALVAAISGWGRCWGLKLLIYLAIVFFALAVALVVLTVKLKEPGIRKLFFILTGASAVGIPICAVLHNLVFALCVKFGWVFWGEGGDEAVFFILAIFVFPALFVIGSLGSIVLLISARLKGEKISKKKVVIYLIAAVFVLWAAVRFVPVSNFSTRKADRTAGFNGSFEITESGLPVNWYIYAPLIKSKDAEIVLDTTDAKDGKQSLKFVIHKCSDIGGWHSPGIFQESPAVSEKSYRISFWLKNQGCKFRVKLESIIGDRSDSKTVLETNETFDAWKRYEYMYTIYKDGTHLRFELNILSPGTLWIDDIRVEEVQKNTGVSPE